MADELACYLCGLPIEEHHIAFASASLSRHASEVCISLLKQANTTLSQDLARYNNSHTVLMNENKRLTAECDRLRKMCPVPYPQFCFQVEKCRGRAYCPRRPSCCE